eukprot:gnl/Hemi2/27930_TR9221_c0_g1_i1.p1 gnl/Hemi2/27930_TR9221_c0_g1~~gnl/Hemi2/27930_TR9221_c0_g1_i1.p1  ORF type:complete len:518 (+),score=167.49 gnl/Hemi2/27930_TR9221_c0_g1_i1:95-1555(+)
MATAAAAASVTPEVMQQADALKDQANKLFADKKYEAALSVYTQAIALNPRNAIYFSNRSFAHLRMESYGSAIIDATEAIKLDQAFSKGYYRRAAAFYSLGKYKEALADFKTVVNLAPNDGDAIKKYKECEKQVRRVAFEEAIATETAPPRSVVEDLDIEAMQVESSYSGIHLTFPLTSDQVVQLMEFFRQEKRLHKKYVFQLLVAIKAQLASLPSVFDVTVAEGEEVTVCGDTHGQFYDLLNIFTLNGLPSASNPYLFNGDFVDRGSFSVEVILTLFAWKLAFPGHFHLTRGNHECKNLNKIYGFEGEVKAKYTETVFTLFLETFNCLPLAGVINNKVLVLHGGLFSRDGVKLEELRSIDRFREPPDSGLMCEMLWSDPQPMPGRAPSKRGVGLSFGPDVTARFLAENNLDLLVRSHEMKEQGYSQEHGGKCITIFSAPNYCDQMGNKGAFIRFGADLRPKFTQFPAVPHPNVRPMQYANNGMMMA